MRNFTSVFILVLVAVFSLGVSSANAARIEVSPCGGYVSIEVGSDSCVDDPGTYDPPTPTPTVSMTATPLTIEAGRSSQLSFTSSNVTTCSINNGVGSVSANTNGTRTVSPTSNTTYTITCQSASGPVTAQRTITVTAVPESFTAYCSAGPEVAQVNETIQWSATTSAGGGSSQLTWKRGYPSYTKICSGGQNYMPLNNDCSEDIMDGNTCTVEGARCRQSAGCDGQTFSDGEGQSNAHAAYGSVLRYTCTASGSSNATYTYAWSGTNGLTGATQNVSKAYTSAGTKSAQVSVSASSGGTAVATCSAEVVSKTPTATLTANPKSMVSGLASLLTWSSTNASSCTLNEGIGSVSTSGTRSVSPGSTTTYTLMCVAPGTGSTAGTWQYYDSDTSDFSCPLTDTNKAYSSVANCPSNPQGKACTGGSGMTVCKKNTVNGCNINTDLYQCQASPSSPPQVATASATVTVNNSVAACYQASTKKTICVDGLNNPGDDTCIKENPACPPGITAGGYYLVTGQSCLAGSMSPGGGVQHWPGHEFTKVNESFCKAPLPDLTAGSISPTTATAGTAQTFSATVSNIGTGAAGVSTTRFQRATSAAGAGATTISDVATAAIAAGGTLAKSVSYTFPTAGTQYVRACADTGLAVPESNENNNCGAWTAVNVANSCTGPACLPDGSTLSCAASPATIAAGGSTTWTASPVGPGNYSWKPSEISSSINGGQTLSRTYGSAGTYAMSVSNRGATAFCSNNVTVSALSCGTAAPSISASPTRVQSGSTSVLTVSASGVDTTCVVSGPGVSRTISGSSCTVPITTITTGSITSLSTYTISCDSGEFSAKVLVNVVPKIQEF